MQDVAVKVVDRIHTLASPSALRPWLRAVAANAVRQAARGGAAGAVAGSGEAGWRELGGAELADERLPDRGAGPRDEAEAAIARALELPIELREPLVLRALGGLSQKEIAEGLGLPETTVETRLASARRALRERTGAREGARRVRG
jgi:RNA polymerase sigma-70 factor (ECF subfamily)